MKRIILAFALLFPAPAAGHDGCHTLACHHRVGHKKGHAKKVRVVRPYSAYFDRVASCESSGRWWLDTGNGFYGGLQFTLSSWRAMGGRGYPHQNSVLEQKFRGVKLLHAQGTRAWPVCG